MEAKGEGKKQKTADARTREACPFFASRCNIFDSGWQAYFKGKDGKLYFQRFYFGTSTYSSTFANKAINKTALFAPHYNAYLSLSLASSLCAEYKTYPRLILSFHYRPCSRRRLPPIGERNGGAPPYEILFTLLLCDVLRSD